MRILNKDVDKWREVEILLKIFYLDLQYRVIIHPALFRRVQLRLIDNTDDYT